ncbi:hypothetical protein KP509_31G030100 [Ceratopteris richardii]|uniref:Calmodulin binding protein-like N-terminal domain-containing protein n=1 Tax=Ceratopteris richardii TaxID=49495 RepID=A0A8T2QYL5_CERRI|nr:hypothetical protein KP509_31G030100 [Ceratopteris richardii]
MLDMDKADMVGSARKDHNSSNDIAERDLEKCEMYDNVTAPRIKLQKVSSFRSVVLEALRNEKIQNLRVVVKEDTKATFETFMCDFKQFMYQAFAIQTEELKKHWLKMQVCSEGSQLRIPDSGLQLQFRYDPPHDVYTGEKLEGGHFVLICRFTGEIVNSGPLSNAEVQIVVIQGGFGKKNNEWTSKDFEDNVVTERDDKAPLLTGDLIVTLKEGIGNLGELTFTDNSSWVKSKKFRLGVKVVTKSCDGILSKKA